MTHASVPRVGLGVMIWKDGKVLLGKRKSALGTNEYSFPGGHLEPGESFAAGALREVAEECGINVKNLRFQLLANILDYAPKHYVQIGFMADWDSGEPRVLEPEKCEGWDWYQLERFPEPLFAPTRTMVESYRSGVTFMDTE
ncbi:MAG: hypothetical protein A3C93_02680 [Candidatus Lloydbacteria bacterium RIFCSPHIGHO2_02_FULL_54_17]|uniref:Nudix hydrolase domain-containing protein n=1 Tax=Candidatus Lloydbacteria bacterium RIFCSPHIGHO2_02_FULL_54_17 TaxID=1798664 RepID=A0A1G2DDI9_9BACT|nr:MAG: hypothetical protein A2762_05930 [Candidatus Lloydbacteria bacterium RIFCSPHIGHO2_01_FULL_54_11]OGZ10930.1 MAG: hypothetical protein A3C93_02680 [Candidatus Lloydbacteria bacterium RIFCSPHIGHO2_02_FULL_54_17]OGZ14911.1 MAG: hypothetical protein A2948_05275 [Candidatus Lloydbacteria bacterium RIFCSPLOWO2_01_FULL_54_18]OGZ15868.1 MAG: hypothetical protein A3H76_06795 [Candidatus Lloydbacteria bacterium RIFCSPLOWO2_02_FULL_54_12]